MTIVRAFHKSLGFNNTILRESGGDPVKGRAQKTAGDRYQVGLRREEPFGSQSRTRLKEWNLTPMERGAKPEECLGQANFDKSQGFSIIPWDLTIPF